MNKIATIVALATGLLSGCKSEVLIECSQIKLKEVEALILEHITEDYNIVRDTLNDSTFVLSIEQDSPSKTVLEKYVFDYSERLTGYYFYNDFQKSNPMLLTAKFKTACVDSVDIEGWTMSYRVYRQDSADVFYVRAASPVFAESILTLNKEGDVEEQLTDSVKINNNTWAYGLKHEDMKSINYEFITTYLINGNAVFSDTLQLALPVVPSPG